MSNNKTWYAFLILLLWAPLPLASNRLWSSQLLVLLFAILSVVVCIALLKHAKSGARLNTVALSPAVRAAKWPIMVLLAIQFIVLFQHLHFVSGVLIEAISPVSFFACNQVQQLIGTTPSCYSASVASEFSYQYFLLGSAYTMVFVLALQLINSTQRLRQFAYSVVLMGVFQAAYGTFSVLADFRYLFLVEKLSSVANATGTFMNRNHLAGYLGLALSLGTGLLLVQLKGAKFQQSWREQLRDFISLILSEKFRLRLFLAVMVVGLVMTRSRGGNLAFFSALSCVAVFYLWQDWRKRSAKGQARINKNALIFFISLFLIDTYIVGQWFGFEKLKQRIQNTEVKKEVRLDIYNSVGPKIQKVALLGSGAGTAENVIPLLADWPARVPFEHVHNDYIELVLTMGLPAVTLLAIFIAIILWRLFKNKPKLPEYACLMSIIYIAIHSVSDFNLYIPAVVVTLMAILALPFVSETLNTERKRRRKTSTRHE